MELPERDHSPTVTTHSLAYTQLRSLLDNSAIDRRHSFHADLDQLQERLQSLSTTVDTRRDATSSDVEHSHLSRAYRRDAVKRPPINLPNFYGDVMHWKSFWATFSSAIGDDPNLSNINKLSYLQGCIKDPNLNSITFTGVDFDAEYDDVVADLQRRYDEPRTVHAAYCNKMAETSPIVCTKDDLNKYANDIYTSFED